MTQTAPATALAHSPDLVAQGSLVSKKAKFPDAEIVPPYPYAIGDRFVVPQDAVLPDRCVKCGNAPTEPWLRKTFSWHHPALYLLLISPLFYLIVALIVRKRIQLAVPLCDAHKSIRRKRLWMASGLLLTCIPFPVWLAAYLGNDAGDGLAICLGLGMFVAGLIFLAYASPLHPTRIRSQSAEFKGAARDFLMSLSPAPRAPVTDSALHPSAPERPAPANPKPNDRTDRDSMRLFKRL